MPPTLHLVRHAEGPHNTAWHGEGIKDPFLTDHGREQCEELCSQFPHHDKIELLMASPMKRCIETCKISFQPAVDRLQKILLMPLAQEASDEHMDTGSSTEEIKEAFGDLVDEHRLVDVHPYWNKNIGRFGTDPTTQMERARQLRCFIMGRQEKHVAIVSHGSFNHCITGKFKPDGTQTTRMWNNAECRSYTFDESSGEEALIVETEESISRRPELNEGQNN
ncbi:hypothetical protein B0A50_05433 [Salinomyces thailandicus]|uniref:Phosphoglycerate mutase-like protein n=1 Tax=Salinomyces thailandicus TaxID=706561 RepID=A0A4U0TUE0_9PEZI|nr:hypothetical protein B0A50_05433 [Salinomyces thailandica]